MQAETKKAVINSIKLQNNMGHRLSSRVPISKSSGCMPIALYVKIYYIIL